MVIASKSFLNRIFHDISGSNCFNKIWVQSQTVSWWCQTAKSKKVMVFVMMVMKVVVLVAAVVIGVNHLWSSWSLGVQTAVVALSHDNQSRWCKVAKNPTYFCELVIRIFFWEVLHIITTSCLNILNIRIFCNKNIWCWMFSFFLPKFQPSFSS